jgi:hypothetical protein
VVADRRPVRAADAGRFDYVLTAAHVAAWLATLIGAVGLASAVAGALTLLRSIAARRINPRWIAVAVPVIAVGVLVAYSERVITAGSTGANIGAGFCIVFVLPLVLALVASASVRAVRLRRAVPTMP